MPSDTDETTRTASRTDDPTLSRRRLLGGAAAATAVGLAGCAGSVVRIETTDATVERTFDASGVSSLRVDDAADDVGIERTDGDVVHVTAEKVAHGSTSLDDLELEARLDDDTLRLATRKTPVGGIGGGSLDLRVAVPSSVRVDRVAAPDGTVGLDGVTGDPTVESGDGDIAARDVAGDLDAVTDDGDVVVSEVGGTVAASSRDGDVVVRDPGAVSDLRTDDGDVVAGVPAVDGTTTVRSHDGDVIVRLGDDLDATVEATTHDGDVVVAGTFDDVESVTEKRITGRVGDGANSLRVHSDDGDVTLTSESLDFDAL